MSTSHENTNSIIKKKNLSTVLIYEAFHVNSQSVAQNSAVFGSCSN